VALERLQTWISFDPQEQVASDPDDVTEPEIEADMAAEEYTEAEEVVEVPVTRSQVLGISAAAAGVGVIISILLTVSIFIGINRTLNYSRHAAVRDLIRNVEELGDRLEAVDSALVSAERRLEALEGLSGRMIELENEVADLDVDVQAATAQVQQMQTRMEQVSLKLEELSRQTENQATFFERLQALLTEVFGAPVEENAE
jgi:methyl-accepting chemotaxis protein